MISPELLPPELTNLFTRVFIDTRAEARRALDAANNAEEQGKHLRKIFKMMDVLHNFPGRFSKNPELALTELHREFLIYENAFFILPSINSDGTRGRYSGLTEKLFDKLSVNSVRD